MPVFSAGDRWVAVASGETCVSVCLGTGDRSPVLASDLLLKVGKSCVNIPDRAAVPLAARELAIRDVFVSASGDAAAQDAE